MSDNNECGVLFSLPLPLYNPPVRHDQVLVDLEGLGNGKTFVIFDIRVFPHPHNYITIIIIVVIIIATHSWLAGGGHLVFIPKSRASRIITTCLRIRPCPDCCRKQCIIYNIILYTVRRI